jgi:hypothetical protein
MSKLKYDKTKFKSEEEYNKFLRDKMDEMMNKIKSDPKLLNVFKRLNNR